MNSGTAGLILHVDEEQLVRASTALLLRAEGYGASSAANGAEAFQLASGGLHPDVLIVDFNLGQQLDGAEIAEHIGRIVGYAPPIIMLTGDVGHAKFPRMVNVVVWLTRKPVNPQLLLAALTSLVQLSRDSQVAFMMGLRRLMCQPAKRPTARSSLS